MISVNESLRSSVRSRTHMNMHRTNICRSPRCKCSSMVRACVNSRARSQVKMAEPWTLNQFDSECLARMPAGQTAASNLRHLLIMSTGRWRRVDKQLSLPSGQPLPNGRAAALWPWPKATSKPQLVKYSSLHINKRNYSQNRCLFWHHDPSRGAVRLT